MEDNNFENNSVDRFEQTSKVSTLQFSKPFWLLVVCMSVGSIFLVAVIVYFFFKSTINLQTENPTTGFDIHGETTQDQQSLALKPEVKLEGNKLVVSFNDEITQELELSLSVEALEEFSQEEIFVTVYDINFDGYNDLWILSDVSNDRTTLTYTFYVFNGETNTFDQLDSLPPLGNPQFFSFSRTLVATNENGYPVRTSVYEYVDYFEQYNRVTPYQIDDKKLILNVEISGSSTSFRSPSHYNNSDIPESAITSLSIDIPPYTTVKRVSYQNADEKPRIIGWGEEVFGDWTSKNSYSFLEVNYLSENQYKINSVITYDFLQAKFRYASESESAILKEKAWFDNRFLEGNVEQEYDTVQGLTERTIGSTAAASGYLSKPITIRYPVSFPVNESGLGDDFIFVSDPGINNQWLPLVESSNVIAAAYSGDNLFYLNLDDSSEIKILNLYHIDIVSGASQLIDRATTSQLVFELREIDKIHGYASEFLYDAMPRVENGHAVYDWLDGKGKVKRLSDNLLVYQSTCEKELNGIRRIFSISEDGLHFLTSCPDGLYLGDWSNLKKMTFSTTKQIQGMWPHFTSDREFEFVNRAEADSLSLNFPRYRADIDGNLLEQVGSAYGGY